MSESGGHRPFYLVTKPSNADGGFGVAFWQSAGATAAEAGAEGGAPAAQAEQGAAENADVQAAASAAPPSAVACGGAVTPLLDSMRLHTMLSAGNAGFSSEGADSVAASAATPSAFCSYLRTVGLLGCRPYLLLQPLVPQLAQNYEIKIYFLQRKVFFASLVYGKEKLVAKVVRPATDPQLFTYLQPLIDESLRALDALPSDGPHDPKILMRVDWGVGEPLLPTGGTATDEGAAAAAGDVAEGPSAAEEEAAGSEGFLKRALVKRASSHAPPAKRLKRSQQEHAAAPLTGPSRHFINEVEIHPGYYVDWDETPDETIAPLAAAYGEYLVKLLAEKRASAGGAS